MHPRLRISGLLHLICLRSALKDWGKTYLNVFLIMDTPDTKVAPRKSLCKSVYYCTTIQIKTKYLMNSDIPVSRGCIRYMHCCPTFV